VLNGRHAKALRLKANFLKEGTWNAFIASDDPACQENILTEKQVVKANEQMMINLNKEGGYVARFIRTNN